MIFPSFGSMARSASSALIVDECPVVRYGLRHILAQHLGCDLIAESTGPDALDRVRSYYWGAVILGTSVVDGGMELLEEMVRSGSCGKVILLSSLPEAEYASRALDAGAVGYLTKRDSVSELVVGLRKIFSGASYMSSAVESACGDARGVLPHEVLSGREYSVFLGIAAGRRLSLLASDLHLNSKTISTYRRRVLEKMKMDSNADLVAYALRHIPHGEAYRESVDAQEAVLSS
jgi:DNA-binding NarL/FixJ family response regulator